MELGRKELPSCRDPGVGFDGLARLDGKSPRAGTGETARREGDCVRKPASSQKPGYAKVWVREILRI